MSNYPMMFAATRRVVLLVLAVALMPLNARGEDSKGQWVSISESVTSQVKPGYPGKTAGVAVDPATGEVFMVVPDQGMWKSADHGKTFARVDEKLIGGRCETGFALNFDPAGKRLACFMIYGPSASTADSGKSWLASKTTHLDFGAVDWQSTGKCFLALRHESGGLLCLTTDSGQTWKDLEKGFTIVGVFNAKTLISSRGKGLVRSDDGGASWKEVSDITPSGYAMRTLDGVGYWLTKQGMLVSRDEGKTWKIEGGAVDAVYGPFWGKSPKNIVVVGKAGFHESLDGGETWKVVAPLPDTFNVGLVGPNYAWDAIGGYFYASSMGKVTFRFAR